MNEYHNTPRALLLAFAALGLTLGTGWSATARAELDLSEVPLYLTAAVEPNIMFTLDDSGSMQFEVMPDNYAFWGETNGSVPYVFPRANGVYGSSDYSHRVATVDNVAYNAIMRSPQVNSVYYNPAVTYTPWSKHDGSLYPAASPTCALHNPERSGTTSAYCRDLTADNGNYNSNYWHTCDSAGSCTRTNVSKTFWPATYFWHNGGDIWTFTNYTRVEIRTGSSYSGHGRADRKDCAAVPTCSYEEEIQNFANWYTYYRSRILTARAGIGRAFAQQDGAMRVGFGAINEYQEATGDRNLVDEVRTNTLINGVRSFSGADREEFFTRLYTHPIPAMGTPLRRALADVGEYFKRTDNRGPWGRTPGTNDTAAHLECRQSYNILMTDGYWSGSSPGVANEDGTAGSTISAPDGSTYRYSPQPPYMDSYSDTLADVAMLYWKNDLRGDLDNKVPANSVDPAFWQHMVTFTVGLGVTGTLDPSVDLPSLENGDLAWPEPDADNQNDPKKLDDLWHAAINSRGGFFSAAEPEAFAEGLSDTLQLIASRVESSASAVAANSTRLDTNTLIYQARFDSRDWSGQLLSYALNSDGTLEMPAQWDAGTLIPDAASRNIYTYKDSTAGGVAFQWANLSASQQAALNTSITGTTDALGADRVSWLRGDSSEEQRNGGDFRDRARSILGDIVNSDPNFAGNQDFGYSILPGTEGAAYTDFRADENYTGRPGMLYVGANAGMLHGFDATTGVEKLAYVPAAVYSRLSALTSPDYSHKYMVDGSPRTGDAYIDTGSGAAWRTVLVGATGAGGRSVFALDVTDPDSFGAGDVLWELNHAELGYSIGQPTIARLKADDSWVAIFGNGYNSDSHRAQLFIVDLADGSTRRIDTGVGDAANPNGLSTPVPVDIDGDRITDYVYAGDLHGNLWKFDLSGNNASSWSVAYGAGTSRVPLFTAMDADGLAQPITTRPTVGRHPDGGVMVYFGTGKFFEVSDGVLPVDPPIQTFYGIRDNGSAVAGRSDLQEQVIVWEGTQSFTSPEGDILTSELRTVSTNAVDYTTEEGWYLDLIYDGNEAGERIVSPALLRHGRIIFTTLIPSADICDGGGSSWLMELDAQSGRRLTYSVLDLNGDRAFDSGDYVDVDGESIPMSGRRSKEGITKTPAIISAGDTEYKHVSGSSGGMEMHAEKGNPKAGRQSWRLLR